MTLKLCLDSREGERKEKKKRKEKTFLLFGFNKFGEIILNKEKSSLENVKGQGRGHP